MTPLTTRARELAARERKLYDQRTIPAVLEELADEVERLTQVEAVAEVLLASTNRLIDAGNGAKEKLLGWRDRALAAEAGADKLRAEAANSAAQRDEALNQLDSARHQIDALEARLASFLANQHYQYIGADGKPVLARNLEDRLIAAEAELARIRAADRTSITVRTTEAAKMRKGQAI